MRYDERGASSRVRFMQYFAPLQQIIAGLRIDGQSLLDSRYLDRRYAGRSVIGASLRCYARRLMAPTWRERPDLRWVEKELWPYVPAAVEKSLLAGGPYALDLDDAIFHSYDLHPSRAVRRLLGDKIDRLMSGAALVTAGNSYLADRAHSAGARRVEVLPTVIDLARYPVRAARHHETDDALRIGWIGSPATVRYLGALAEPLAALARERPLRLIVVGATIELPGVDVVSLPWSEETEAESVANFDIGVMPLPDSPWERGKCGYKLIQCMACSVPVVASPVGVNATIVQDGVNGFLAADAGTWFEALAALASDPDLRTRCGSAGRRLVEERYSLQATAPRLAGWLVSAAGEAR